MKTTKFVLKIYTQLPYICNYKSCTISAKITKPLLYKN